MQSIVGPIGRLAYRSQHWSFLINATLVQEAARLVSLSMRLMGNMASDHKVVATFPTLVPLLVPVPFLILGTLVVVVQTLVFCLLSMVYISMAVAHEEHH